MTSYLHVPEIDANQQPIKNYDNFHKPIVLRNYCKNTIAYKTWNLDTFPKIFNNVDFMVEVYKNKNDLTTDTGFEKFTIKEIIDHYINNKQPHIYCAQIDLNKIKNYDSNNKHNISECFQNINPTERIPEERLLFFGKDAKSGCHLHIQDDYLLNQIFGQKTIYLFDYNDNDQYISCNFFSKKQNFISQDFFKLPNKYPNMKIYKVVLNAGDSLLIPPWWWHATEGHDINCSVTSVFFRNNNDYLNNKPYLRLLFFYSNYIENFIDKIKNNLIIIKYGFLFTLIVVVLLIIYIARQLYNIVH